MKVHNVPVDPAWSAFLVECEARAEQWHTEEQLQWRRERTRMLKEASAKRKAEAWTRAKLNAL